MGLGFLLGLPPLLDRKPFSRNSKLTQLLKDSLGGTCLTSMIANISPSHLSLGENTNTLHWADRAKMIRSITAKINDKASLISKTIRTFRACTEARERALGMLWDLKVSTMSDVYR